MYLSCMCLDLSCRVRDHGTNALRKCISTGDGTDIMTFKTED